MRGGFTPITLEKGFRARSSRGMLGHISSIHMTALYEELVKSGKK